MSAICYGLIHYHYIYYFLWYNCKRVKQDIEGFKMNEILAAMALITLMGLVVIGGIYISKDLGHTH